MSDSEWQTVDNAPPYTWLRTRREGEDGENVCAWRSPDGPPDKEWVERDGGRTTVTHHYFAAPTHWAPLDSRDPMVGRFSRSEFCGWPKV